MIYKYRKMSALTINFYSIISWDKNDIKDILVDCIDFLVLSELFQLN